ncbi:RES family NAD+ phosphorylase [Pseudomonas sp. LRF_L74]|uniref:RES family NAD+ phosphorylase n=1 Tax=Pseudomonas sp. LRF_L74 TaxID=3369422 RepID=UPI003F632E26
MDIWNRCDGLAQIKPIRGALLRMVENQEQVATTQLVDTLDEQAVLEQLLEASKPPLPTATEALHYLLQTPFRYPPLRWGSRFGRKHEPSLFYGAGSLETAMAETAFYRFVLWHGMATPPPSGRILSEHSSFEAQYRVERGVRLQQPPFDAFAEQLSDRSDYRHTQRLGSAMRDAGVEAFEYRSARCDGVNVALYTPRAFAKSKPSNLNTWLCETTSGYVAFKQAQGAGAPIRHDLSTFLVDGRLPQPA